MTIFTTTTKALVVTAAVALLAACGGGSDGDKAKTGTLKLGITDAPVDDALAVWVKFTGVELKPKAGQAYSVDFASPKSINLLNFQGTDRAILLDEQVTAGEYEWVRLKVQAEPNILDDTYLVDKTGASCEMRIPSGDETGLKVIRGFTIAVGGVTDFTFDFDLRKSIVAPPGQNTPAGPCGGQVYTLKPVLRVVDNLQVGTITGAVRTDVITSLTQCGSSTESPYPGNVYLYRIPDGLTDITPDDYDGIVNDANGPDPIASAKVDQNTFRYTIGFVAPGRYQVAYTCDMDNVTLDADVTPAPPALPEVVDLYPVDDYIVTVDANKTTTADFPRPTL